MPAEDLSVTATWTIVTYTITFDSAGGSAVTAITQDYGTAITPPADPTWVGHYFVGWDNELPMTMPAENMTITAVWKTKVDIPVAVSGLVYNGLQQTGFVAATGYTLTGNTGTVAGSYSATATLYAGYIWSDETEIDKTIPWSINKASLTATYPGETIFFGETPALTVNVTGFVNGETAASAAGYLAPTITNANVDVGTYALTPSGGSADNYTFSYVAGDLVIQAAAQDVTSAGYTGTYDGSAHGITVTQTGGTVTYSADGITYGADPLTYTGAGTYTVYFKVVKDNHSDYTGSETVTINKKELAKPTDDLSTFTYTGSEQTYAPAGIDISTMTVSGAARTDAGSQTVAVSITDKTNYQWTDATQTDVTFDFTIGPKEITVTPDVLSKVYGGADPVFTYTLSEAVAVTGALSREPGEDVGTYAMTLGDLSAGGNYTLSLVPTNFAITKAPLTITADDKAMTFGGAEPEYTVTYTGFVNGETQTALAGTLSVTSGYDSGVYAPTAVITASGLTSANYAITYETGVLTVSKIQVDAPTAVTGLAYSGTQQTGVAAAAGYTLTGNTGTDAGDYTATAALADGYIWSDSTTAAKTIPWNITPYVGSLIIKFESVYEGSPTEPPVIVKDDLGATLIRDVDYSISYENNTGTGTATVIVTGMGNYLGTTGTSHFEVTAYTLPNNLGNVVIKDKATGKVLGPKDIVYQGQKLIVTPSSKIEGDYVIYDWQGNSIGSDGDYTVSGPVYGPFTVEGIPIPDPENVGEWGTTLGISLIILLILLRYVRYRMRSGL
jgi:hypothetical protein